jgi:hypothetical protein
MQHSGVAWLDHHYPLTPAQHEASSAARLKATPERLKDTFGRGEDWEPASAPPPYSHTSSRAETRNSGGSGMAGPNL